MRVTLAVLLTAVATGLGGGGCGGTDGAGENHGFDGGSSNDAMTAPDMGRLMNNGDSGHGKKDGSSGGDGSTQGVVLSNLTLLPATDSITVASGATGTVTYKVMGSLGGGAPEDVTDRFVFWAPGTIPSSGLPNNYLIGSFPAAGGPTFTTRLPVLATDPPSKVAP